MKLLRFFFLLAGLACLPGFPVALEAQDAVSEVDSGFKEIELFTEVLETIRQGYVDGDKVTYEKLINSALEGMLEDLDPHCQFMQPKVFDQLKRHTDSTYEGVELGRENDQMAVMFGKIKITNLAEMMTFTGLFERLA